MAPHLFRGLGGILGADGLQDAAVGVVDLKLSLLELGEVDRREELAPRGQHGLLQPRAACRAGYGLVDIHVRAEQRRPVRLARSRMTARSMTSRSPSLRRSAANAANRDSTVMRNSKMSANSPA